MDIQKLSPLLVANRGEIAQRVIRTCRRIGIDVIALKDKEEKYAPYTKGASQVLSVSGQFRDANEIIMLAKKANAKSIHPGYGFFAENPDFAEQCRQAGILFIGPTPEVIAKMGDKKEAKELAKKARVPVLEGVEANLKTLSEIEAMTFPVLLKAASGGGGKGMRIVEHKNQLRETLLSLQEEAKRLYGNPTVLAESYLTKCRHVEVQILGNANGENFAISDRDCSLQRNNQKIIEEAPAPGLDEEVRKNLREAAVHLANAVQYTGAGTVEFLYDPNSHEFYFLEMNTRLQVEHTITEEITGMDLVEEQLKIAAGFTGRYEGVIEKGVAIEARLCAEKPDSSFQPSAGEILKWMEPKNRDWLRIDSGYDTHSIVSPHYDNMLAKVIVRANTRKEAIEKLTEALQEFIILGVDSNIPLLIHLLHHPIFVQENMHTKAVYEMLTTLKPNPLHVDMAAMLYYAHLANTLSSDLGDRRNFMLFDEPSIFYFSSSEVSR
ncbi:MAG: ATP-grasp domain-containing protein [Candidatus Hydrogenedentota bacterium]|nr:MAG: ATP-grasp domain-containing protein [Candidatus Hydrogenedentota bacterium]